MFRRSRIPAILLLLLAFMAAASAQVAQQPQSKPRRFLMWKATSPTVAVYLVGSIHVGDSSMYPLPREVESAFAAARILAVEINIKNADAVKSTRLMLKYGMYDDPNDSLSNHISKEESLALDDFCSKNNLPRAGVEQLKPWAVALLIAASSWKEAGEDPNLGIDMHFLNESKEPQRIDELESVDSQVALFANATEEEQQALLASTLKQRHKLKDMIKRVQTAYVSGDPEALQKIMDEESDLGTRSLTKKLLDDRNVTMAARLDEYLKGKEPAFVVVGAAHIIGDKGVARLLRDKGYKVEQVTLEAK